MRTAIFFVGLELYGVSIALGGKSGSSGTLTFVSIILLVLMLMDIVDFIKGLSK